MRTTLITITTLLAIGTAAAQSPIVSPYLNAPWDKQLSENDAYRARWRAVWDYIPPPPPACDGKFYCAYHPGMDMKVIDADGSLDQIEWQIRTGKLKRWYGAAKGSPDKGRADDTKKE